MSGSIFAAVALSVTPPQGVFCDTPPLKHAQSPSVLHAPPPATSASYELIVAEHDDVLTAPASGVDEGCRHATTSTQTQARCMVCHASIGAIAARPALD